MFMVALFIMAKKQGWSACKYIITMEYYADIFKNWLGKTYRYVN